MNIVISGYYGFHNLGDEALLAGLIRSLSETHHLTILSNDPDHTSRLHKVNATSRLYGVIPALLSADALISGGGGLLQDKTSYKSLQYYLGVIRLAKWLNKRVIIYGQSIGPLSPRGQRAVKTALHNTRVAVRDRASLYLLSSLGISATLVADSALLLPKPEHAASTSGSQLPPNPVLLIPRGGYDEITKALIFVAQALTRDGVSVAALSLHPQEDDAALNALQTQVPDVHIWQATTPDAALQYLNEASYVVSGRLHGLILAAVAEKDYAGLVYDPKVSAFLLETGAPAFSFPIDQTNLLDVIQKRISVPPNKVQTLKNRAYEGVSWLQTQLEL